jgi:hypothetical protein
MLLEAKRAKRTKKAKELFLVAPQLIEECA